MRLLLLLLSALAAATAAKQKRSMVWVYGSDIFPSTKGSPKLEATLKGLAAHTDSFNAVSPQMYSVGCDTPSSGSGCAPILISDTSDPGITPDPALATRFHALGVEYWPTLSSPDWLNSEACSPPQCGDGVAKCPCGQK